MKVYLRYLRAQLLSCPSRTARSGQYSVNGCNSWQLRYSLQLDLPPEYQQTAKGEQFLLYDSGPETQWILIFGTQSNLEMLRLSDFWLDDGTFKTAPPLFTQVYVVHTLRGGPQPMRDGHLLPSLFVLLPNKTEAT